MENRGFVFCQNPELIQHFEQRSCGNKPVKKTAKRGTTARHLILILLLSSLTSITTGCGNTTDLAEEKRKRYQVDNNISASKLDPESGKSAVLNAETGIAIEVDVDTLIAKSKMLEMRARQITFKDMLADLATQQKISERLLQLELDQDQRLFAIQNLLFSLLRRIATTDLKARENIYEIIPTYLDDDDRNVQQLAWNALVTMQLTDYLRVEDSESADLDSTIDEILIRFKDDPIVARELQEVVVQLMMRERREKAVEVMEKLSTAFANSSNPKLQNMAGIIKDRIYLTQIQYDLTAEKMRQGQDGYKEKFLSLVQLLATRQDMGKEIYREILQSEQWLEEIDQYEDAEKILVILEENLKNHEDETFCQIVAEDIARARTRLGLIGKPLILTGQSSAGKSLSTEELKGKVTLLVFWSATEPSSVKLLQQLVQIYRRYQPQGVEIVSFCIDKNISQALSVFGNQAPPWISMYRKTDTNNPQGLQQMGIQRVPYLALLDRDGKVADLGVSIQKLPDELQALLKR